MVKHLTKFLFLAATALWMSIAGCGSADNGGATGTAANLSAPTGVSATAGDGQAALSWNAVANATSYNIYYATSAGAPGTKKSGITGTSDTVTGLTNGSAYYFTVTAADATSESARSSETAAYVTANIPKFAYAVNSGSNTFGGSISVYAIDPATGALTAAGTPVTIGKGSTSITIASSGKFAYVISPVSAELLVYSLDQTTGALTAGTAVATGTSPQSLTITASGKFAYVANYGATLNSGTVSVYKIDQTTGALTPGTAVAAGSWTVSVAVDPAGKFAYAVNSGNAGYFDGLISVYTIDQSTGALTAGTAVSTGTSGLRSLTVDPLGKFAYVLSNEGFVSVYSINQTTGALTAVTTVTSGTNPIFFSTDPAWKFAYVANSISNYVSAYVIDQTTGALTSETRVTAGVSPTSVTVDPSGRFAYVANGLSNDISVYTVNPATGALTAVGSPVAAGLGPLRVVVDPSGKFAYAANSSSDSISAYKINQTTGALTAVGAPVAAGKFPNPVTIL